MGRRGKEEGKKGEIQEEIASGALIRPGLIREWFADFSPAHQFVLKVVLVLFDSNKSVWTGPSHFLPAELGQTQTAGLGWKLGATVSSGNAHCLGTQQTLLALS